MSQRSAIKRTGLVIGASALGILSVAVPAAVMGSDANTREDAPRPHPVTVLEQTSDADPPADWRRLLNEVDTPPDGTEPDGIVCFFGRQFLPRTADAIEGWYRNC